MHVPSVRLAVFAQTSGVIDSPLQSPSATAFATGAIRIVAEGQEHALVACHGPDTENVSPIYCQEKGAQDGKMIDPLKIPPAILDCDLQVRFRVPVPRAHFTVVAFDAIVERC